MEKEAKILIENAVRWCGNILAELTSNYGQYVSIKTNKQLREVIMLLQFDIAESLHKEDKNVSKKEI
jgi:hypothetical protein